MLHVGSTSMRTSWTMNSRVVFALIVAGLLFAASPAHSEPDLVIDASMWRIISSESGPTNYYTVVSDGGSKYVHARYVPPMKTAVMGFQMADADRQRARKLRWTWRAVTLPAGGDECVSSKADS